MAPLKSYDYLKNDALLVILECSVLLTSVCLEFFDGPGHFIMS